MAVAGADFRTSLETPVWDSTISLGELLFGCLQLQLKKLATLLCLGHGQAAHEGLELRDVSIGHIGGQLRVGTVHLHGDDAVLAACDAGAAH